MDVKENQGTAPPVKENQGTAPPKTWLIESILVTLFCCLPLGIVGIINASKVESAHYAGDHQRAQNCSRTAGKFTKIGFWVSLGFIILYFLLMILGVAASAF